jgi:hypothetical protein
MRLCWSNKGLDFLGCYEALADFIAKRLLSEDYESNHDLIVFRRYGF